MIIKKLSIIIPCFNEAPTIYKILDKIKGVALIDNIEKEIIIVMIAVLITLLKV